MKDGQKTPNARQGITTDTVLVLWRPVAIGQKTPNARQGITTPWSQLASASNFSSQSENPQCPTGHYDKFKSFTIVLQFKKGQKTPNARQGITTHFSARSAKLQP